MYCLIENNIIQSYSKTKIEGGLYTEQNNLCGGLIITSSSIIGTVKIDGETINIYSFIYEQDNDIQRQADLQEFITLEKKAKKLKNLHQNASDDYDGDCPPARKTRIGILEGLLYTRKDTAEDTRNLALDTLISTHSDGTTEGDTAIIEEIANMLEGDI